MSIRPRKVETVLLGSGIAALALAVNLSQQGRQIALLAENGWENKSFIASPAWHTEPNRASVASKGVEQLLQWQEAGLPGITLAESGEAQRYWKLDYGLLLPALAARIASFAGCFVATETRVRGISVIENAILGAIAEDARYDARQLINAAEDERYTAFSRMLRRPHSLKFSLFSPPSPPTLAPFLCDQHLPTIEESGIKGAWRIYGIAGWPLLALGISSSFQLPSPRP